MISSRLIQNFLYSPFASPSVRPITELSFLGTRKRGVADRKRDEQLSEDALETDKREEKERKREVT